MGNILGEFTAHAVLLFGLLTADALIHVACIAVQQQGQAAHHHEREGKNVPRRDFFDWLQKQAVDIFKENENQRIDGKHHHHADEHFVALSQLPHTLNM